MISAYTGTQIRAAEQPFLEAGVGAVLMQRAAYGLANAVVRELQGRGERLYGASVTVLAGKGNNGGDGLFAAAMLAGRGMRTTAVLTAERPTPGLAAFEKAGGRVIRLATGTSPAARRPPRRRRRHRRGPGHGRAGRAPRPPRAELIEALGRSRPGLVVACDIPSGVDADTGEAHAPVLRAELTVTFGAAKAGLLADPGADFAGRVQVVPIGVEAALPDPALRRLKSGDLAALCPTPGGAPTSTPAASWAWSPARSGTPAPRCWPAARWRPGSGMVRYLGPPDVADLVRRSCPEVVCGTGSAADAHVQAWLLGPGIDEEAHEQLERVREAAATGLPVRG